jgi:hypothetical protein
MVIYPDEVRFTACRGHVKNVDLTVEVTDSSDDKYDRSYSMPDTITIMGSSQAVASIDSVAAKAVEIGYYYEDTDIELTLELPEGIILHSDPAELVLKLTVKEKTDEEDKTDEP